MQHPKNYTSILTVDAMQYTGDNTLTLALWCNQIDPGSAKTTTLATETTMQLYTDEDGWVTVSTGEWVAWDGNEFTRYSNKEFANLFL